MTELDLWLPILVSAVVVFAASSVIHMLPLWHKSDYPGVPDEESFRQAVGPLGIPPGDYMVPRPASMEAMRSPEARARIEQGPNVIMTVLPNEWRGMGKPLSLWFVYLLVLGTLVACVAAMAIPEGADYMSVFKFVGVTAFIAHTVAIWQLSIWYRRSWAMTLKTTFDGLIYALLTAGVFGWLWLR